MSAVPEIRETVATSRRTARTHAVWIGLILVLCLIEGTLILADHGWIGTARWRSVAYAYGAFWAGLLHGWAPNFTGQPVTMFVSYGFLHGGWQHLAGNVATLVWLGLSLGPRCGPGRFAGLYAIALIGGGAGFGLLARVPTPMVGASGAIMGLVAVWIVWEAREQAAAGASRARAAGTALWMSLVVAGFNVMMLVVLHGAMAWQTHLGGFLAGAAGALVWGPDLRRTTG